MSLKLAILGFLSERPLTGYELKKEFDASVRFFWPADQSQIYRTLSKLVEEDLASCREELSQHILSLKRYSITEAGRRELQAWLEGPLVDTPVRDAGLIQIFFYGHLDKEQQIMQLKSLESRLQADEAGYMQLLSQLQALQEKGQLSPERFFKLSTVEYGLRSVRASLDWVRSLSERVQSERFAVLGADLQES